MSRKKTVGNGLDHSAFGLTHNSTKGYFKNYGKIIEIKRDSLDAKQEIKVIGLSLLQSSLGLLTAVAICFGIYISYVKFIKAEDTSTAVVVSQSTVKEEEQEEVEVFDVLFIVNAENPLSEDYEPNLVETQGISVSETIASALDEMCSSALEDGISLAFSCGYVSPEEQQILFEEKVDELIKEGYTSIMANAKAGFYAPKAYQSDSQTGLCVTIDSDSDNFEKSDVYAWLVENAVDYGFVFRYPTAKTDETLHDGDLTVLRYVEPDNAFSMRQLGMCLEEYVYYRN